MGSVDSGFSMWTICLPHDQMMLRTAATTSWMELLRSEHVSRNFGNLQWKAAYSQREGRSELFAHAFLSITVDRRQWYGVPVLEICSADWVG